VDQSNTKKNHCLISELISGHEEERKGGGRIFSKKARLEGRRECPSEKRGDAFAYREEKSRALGPRHSKFCPLWGKERSRVTILRTWQKRRKGCDSRRDRSTPYHTLKKRRTGLFAYREKEGKGVRHAKGKSFVRRGEKA